MLSSSTRSDTSQGFEHIHPFRYRVHTPHQVIKYQLWCSSCSHGFQEFSQLPAESFQEWLTPFLKCRLSVSLNKNLYKTSCSTKHVKLFVYDCSLQIKWCDAWFHIMTVWFHGWCPKLSRKCPASMNMHRTHHCSRSRKLEEQWRTHTCYWSTDSVFNGPVSVAILDLYDIFYSAQMAMATWHHLEIPT